MTHIRVKVIFLDGETTTANQVDDGVVWECKCGNLLSYIHTKNTSIYVECNKPECKTKYRVHLATNGTIVFIKELQD